MNDNFQCGKTQAIDLDELHVATANRPPEVRQRGEFELDKWGEDPWASTEESRKKRRWAEDDAWAGDGQPEESRQEDLWDADEEKLKAGWHAPKRGDELETEEGWEDWQNFGGAPKELELEQESKDFGGYRRVQAASQYAQVDSSNYVDGKAQRDDLYRQKEAFGTSGVRERKGDPYANVPQTMGQDEPGPELVPVGSDWNDAMVNAAPAAGKEEEDMRASAKISNRNAGGDDIPGVTRASIIIFQADAEPVVYELKKLSTTIGRGLDNMVILNDQYASRRHLMIQYVNGRFEVYGLSADNLACVNGFPISHAVLMNGDQIEVGATRIRFVLGPISQQQMVMSAPINGRPFHLDPPPQELRSPKTTRKNLILLISAVSVIVVLMIVGLIVMWVSSSHKAEPRPTIAKVEAETSTSESEQSGAEVAPRESDPVYELSAEDKSVIDTMVESYSAALGSSYRNMPTKLYGNEIVISIDSTPSGARIYNSDNSLRGVTPYEITERTTSDRTETLRLRYDGYEEATVDLSFASGVKTNVELKEIAAPAPVKKPAPVRVSKPKPKPKAKPKPKGGRIMI